MNTQDLRLNYMSISKGLTDAYAKLYKYYPIYEKDYGRMKFLFIATVLHPKYKLRYFQTRESFPRELIERIKADLDSLYMMYDKYYGNQEVENRKSLEFSSPANHQYAIANSTNNYFSYLSGADVFEEDDKEVAAYLSERWENDTFEGFHRCYRKRFSILYAMVRDIMAIPAMSAPAESFFSIAGNVVTKSRNNLSSTTTKKLAVVKNTTNLRLCNVNSGIEFGGTNIDDNPDLCAKISEEIDEDLKVRVEITGDNEDNSYEIFMDKEYEDSNYFGG